MPLQPSRRDSNGPIPVLRQHQTSLRNRDPGYLDGRWGTPQPVTPGPSELVGGDEGGGGDETSYEWQWEDRHVVTATGTQTPILTYPPVEESLFVRWHPAGRQGLPLTNEHFLLDDRTVTIPDPGIIAIGDEFSFQYQFDPEDQEADDDDSFEAAVAAIGDPIVWAALGDPEGSPTAEDSSSHDRDGVYGGIVEYAQPALADGLPGTSVDFTGFGWVGWGTGEAWQRPASFSAMIWVKPHTAAFDMFLFGCDDLGALGPDRCWNIADDTAARIYSGSLDYPADGGEAIGHLPAEVTSMLLMTFDGATLKFYRGDASTGVFALVQTTAVPSAMNTSTLYPLTIGSSANGRVGRFAKLDGLAQHAIMWSEVATEAQGARLFSTGTGLT
jgi:hypothetical protein